MLARGRYRVGGSWHPRQNAQQFLASAVIDVDGDGVVVVYVDQEPLFAFASVDAFFEKYELTADDFEAHPQGA
jgi:hypothetical protein